LVDFLNLLVFDKIMPDPNPNRSGKQNSALNKIGSDPQHWVMTVLRIRIRPDPKLITYPDLKCTDRSDPDKDP